MAEKAGITAALDQVGAGGGAEDEPAQLDLIPAEDVLGARGAPASAAGKRGPGRPPGARNRRTGDMVAWLERWACSPLEALARLWMADPRELAREMGHKVVLTKDGRVEEVWPSPLDVLKIQQQAASAALPYWHARMPTEGEAELRGFLQVVFQGRPAEEIAGSVPGSGGVGGFLEAELINDEPADENDDKSDS